MKSIWTQPLPYMSALVAAQHREFEARARRDYERTFAEYMAKLADNG